MKDKANNFLAELVRLSNLTKDDSFVEIGARDGESIEAVWKAEKNATLFTVDPAPTSAFKKIYPKMENVKLIKQKSDKALKKLKDWKVSPAAVFIDGDHKYKWVRHDITKYWDIWNGQGFFCGHDFTRRKGYGVIQAVCEHFGIDDYFAINRRFETKGGILHVYDTLWFYIAHRQMSLYSDFLCKH